MAKDSPAVSAAISVETLSLSRVKSASPALTKSPDFLCQTETTPLEIDSPTAGIFTSTLMSRLHYAQSIAAGLKQKKRRGRGSHGRCGLEKNRQGQARVFLSPRARKNF